MSEYIILGVDPGLKHTGCGIIEKTGKDIRYLDSGTIDTSPEMKFPDRLVKIYDEIEKVILKYKPDAIAIEQSIYAQNVSIALKLGHARGMVILAAARHHLEMGEYPPKKIKSSLTGNGSATKDQVKFMVAKLLNIKPNMLSNDSSDALAAAICHFNHFKLTGL
ncbi:MAG: crossover junction endodeoxyribonuclease RuvC [Candidatus Marinimicrobia bacterium]|nr:crossover junction endodeoxyribonuclease RuvC [Candidatus Neomarinimicrobiota bacterium]